MNQVNCYCGSGNPFPECCEPYINEVQKAPTAEALMRSRFSAYCIGAVDYLMATTHPSQRKYHSKKDTLQWATDNQWLKLEIIQATDTVVEFKAFFLDNNHHPQTHHEKSSFKFEGSWFYFDGIFFD